MSFAAQIETGDGSISPIGSTLYGICSTAAAAAAKTVSDINTPLINFDTLVKGVTIHVKFTNSNTADNPTLNVNSTRDIAIYAYDTTPPGKTPATSWKANSIVSLTYDGNYWRMNDAGANDAIIALLQGDVTTEATARAAADTQIYSRIAPDYDSTATYRKNDLVVYSQNLYRCNNDITTAEEWTAAHWTATTVAAEREYKIVVSNKQIGVKSTASADIGESTGITSATVDVTEYEKYLQTDAVFVYNQTQWDITGGASGIDPATYGITVEGTAANGDTITITYTAGTFPFKKDTNNTYPEYPYRADVAIDNAKSTMIADVIFALSDAISGVFAPIVESYDGGIYVYATNIPDSSVTIPTIVLWG